MNASSPLLISGLKDIASGYTGILCDVWGVLHNGAEATVSAHQALARFRKDLGGAVVLVTNAPRPNAPIHEQLRETYGIPRDAYDEIVTSGDVTIDLLRKNREKKIYHLGPERDMPLYEGLGLTLVGPDEAELISCTGLFDDETETPETYRELLTGLQAKGLPMICANPDLIVERGHRLIYCGGSLGKLYAELGGNVEILGKPHKPIYDGALARLEALLGDRFDRKKVLCIGDGLPTDILGAVNQGLDPLFITAGIHTAEFGDRDHPDEELIRARVEREGFTIRAAIPFLSW